MHVSYPSALTILFASFVAAAAPQKVLSVRVNLTTRGRNVTVPFVMEDPRGRRTGWISDLRELHEIPVSLDRAEKSRRWE